MDNEFLVIVEYPHSWYHGSTTYHEDEEQQRMYADRIRANSTPEGTENYARIYLARLTEEVE